MGFFTLFNKGLREPTKNGKKIVLTASRAEMATFGNSNMRAMMCTFPYAIVKPFLYNYIKPESKEDGSAKYAPYGLRKIESLLMDEFGEDNVVVAHPDNLELFVGDKTELIGVSTMDPLGLAYVSTTYNSLISFGGESVNKIEFLRLFNHPALRRSKAKKIVGGFGVWQIRDSKMQDKLGIDLLIAGECDLELIPIIKRLLRGEKLPKYIRTKKVYDYEKIPLIKNAASFGTVEIMRGCGRRCQFCSPDYRTKYDFPIEHIMKEVEVNLSSGNDMVFLVSEDVLLYGTDARNFFYPNREKIAQLLKAIAKHEKVKRIGISHASLAPVVADKQLLKEITPIIIEKSFYRKNGTPYIGIDVGIESGSVRIMKRYMNGKALPFPIESWPELVVEGTGIMNDNFWYPMYTFIVGLPGEKDEDVIATLELLDRIKDCKVFYVPLLFIPLEEAILKNKKRATLNNLTPLQWEFIMECWKRNLSFWAENIKPIVQMLSFIMYGIYLKRVHGRNSFYSIMNFVGLSNFVSRKSSCDYSYCFPNHKPSSSDLYLTKLNTS
ncbi:MAG: radical SAM protein [Nitrososphaerales archaeon]